jgi:hypothetical protein
MNKHYEIGIRLGAICVRKECAEQAQVLAQQAHRLGRVSEAFELHREADRHEEQVRKKVREIGGLG